MQWVVYATWLIKRASPAAGGKRPDLPLLEESLTRKGWGGVGSPRIPPELLHCTRCAPSGQDKCAGDGEEGGRNSPPPARPHRMILSSDLPVRRRYVVRKYRGHHWRGFLPTCNSFNASTALSTSPRRSTLDSMTVLMQSMPSRSL